jgi:hypothetical protein
MELTEIFFAAGYEAKKMTCSLERSSMVTFAIFLKEALKRQANDIGPLESHPFCKAMKLFFVLIRHSNRYLHSGASRSGLITL